MLFNSFDFAIFLPIVFILYWGTVNKSHKLQNTLLLAASYIFYGWWDYRFLSLIILTSFINYFVGIELSKTDEKQKRRGLLFISIFVNLGFLGFFKYYNFFYENFEAAFKLFGLTINPQGLKIILPIGISFYTFKALSYTIDVYNKKCDATNDIISFFAFISFFPQLIAGPIERAANLLPQFNKIRVFKYDNAVDGMRQILWGLFMKVVIADNCATYANQIFDDFSNYSGSTLLLGAFLFTIQIYGDFAGYSDIAIGTSRLFGFNSKRNFAYPYFSRDIAEFWRRWHISLTTWFRDYVYIPIGGSRCRTRIKVRNIFIVFLLSGFWHGANWTFITWGALNAVYFLPLMLMNKNKAHSDIVAQGRLLPNLREIYQMGTTFFITTIAWVFFRAETISKAFHYINDIFSISLFSIPEIKLDNKFIIFIIFFVIAEWIQREKQHTLDLNNFINIKIIRWLIYLGIIYSTIYFAGNQQEFIYFKF